ncbi:MAG: hypothetical protein DMD78_12650 [Candidatus Rokuibacteriota bacterium]|nr:MAG: hypothetical protein DMD78_12650 [Candidatus Rokubacteria bacterium]
MNARAGVVALGLLAGCAGGPIVIPLRDETAGARPPVTRPPSPPCRVTVAAVEDERANRDTLGAIGNRPLQADDVREWIVHGMRDVGGAGDGGGPAEAGRPPADIVTRIGIERVYARTVVTQMEAVVALRAAFTAADGSLTERRYRGTGTRVNWVNAGMEFAVLLNEALGSAVTQIAADAGRLCPPR